MIDDFLNELFAPAAPGPASFADRFSPFAGAPANVPGIADQPSPPNDIMRRLAPPMPSPQEYLRNLPPEPDDGGTETMSARAAMPGNGVPLPQARPDIESILAGRAAANGPMPADPMAGAAPAAAPAAPSSDIVAKLAGIFGAAPGAVTPASGLPPQEKVSLMGRLAGMSPKADNQFRSALAGGFAGGNPAFAGGALMKGASGALGGGLKSEKDQAANERADSLLAQKQANFDRSQGDKEQTSAALRKLYGARADKTEASPTGKGNGAWNKPGNERWKDAQKLIIDKQKQIYGGINPMALKAEREAATAKADKEMADFKKQTYKQYGFSEDGTDQEPMPRSGGEVPSTGKTVGDKEATDKGLYPKGTFDDPAEPMSKEEFDALPPGTIFKNPADGRLMSKRG